MISNLAIPSDYVQRCDTSELERLLTEAEKNRISVRKLQGCLAITFPDYETKGITYLNPEVKRFWLQIFERVPHLFYYLLPDREIGYLHIFLSVHSPEDDLDIIGGHVQVKFTNDLLTKLFNALVNTGKFAKKMDDNAEHIIKRLLEPLPQKLDESIFKGIMDVLRKRS